MRRGAIYKTCEIGWIFMITYLMRLSLFRLRLIILYKTLDILMGCLDKEKDFRLISDLI
jgi:hypothetical protein